MKYSTCFIITCCVFFSATIASACDINRLQVVSYRQKSAAVKNVQSCLVKFGYSNPSGATGFYGNETRSAVQRFYAAMTTVQSDGSTFGKVAITALKEVFRVRNAAGPSKTGALMKKVSSVTELRDYFAQAQNYGGGVRAVALRSMETTQAQAPSMMKAQATFDSVGAGAANTQTVDRSSQTNVQVVGVDEPDVIKTDGHSIFYSPTQAYWGRRMIMSDMAPSPNGYREPETTVIDALPVDLAKAVASIPERGELLLMKDKGILIISHGDGFTAYSVSNPNKPVRLWQSKFEENTQLAHTRMIQGKIYAVFQQWQRSGFEPCPMRPLTIRDRRISIPCGDIWMPSRVVQAQSLFTVVEIDAATGSVGRTVAFVGSYGSTVYMSPSNIYVAYQTQLSENQILAQLITTDGASLFPATVVTRIKQTLALPISETARDVEIREVIENYQRSLSSDERLTLETKMQNVLSDYQKKNLRNFEQTIIARIPLSTFTVQASGQIPGRLLNQFSLDEYNGNLRAATTVGGTWGWGRQSESENDVYVLNSGMQIMGSVKGLGLTERIYSARFIGDKGYLVTFRQTDPFYILDLSNPAAPKMTGELKIPGFSSYLHPISATRILGVGREEGKVKLSLFDVSNKYNPTEVSKYMLDEGWTEVENNHHAFLIDERHNFFFIPGGKGGYIISYTGDKLDLVKAMSQEGVRRAVYVNDFLYILGDRDMSIWNEKTWEKIRTVTW